MIYLDYNATTPVDSRVLEAMLPHFTASYGNAASRQHRPGREAARAVEQAREKIAQGLGAEPNEIYFTSGATESCNLAMKGVYGLYGRKGKHIVVLQTEHKAVIDTARFLRNKGAEVTHVAVDANGQPDLEELRTAIRSDTILVCAMWANNETGVILPMREIGEICEERGTILFSDATQAVGKLEVLPRESGVQLLAMSGHKIYGPKGIGVLYVSQRNPRIKLEPLIHGGAHEGGLRSGTLNVPGIVGVSEALTVALADRVADSERLAELRDLLERELTQLEEVYVNAPETQRLSHVSNIRFRHVNGEALMTTFQTQLAVASGSACTSADPDPSHVLMAMGMSRDVAKSCIRFSLGRSTDVGQIMEACQLVRTGVQRVRDESPAWKLFVQGLI